MVSYGDKIDVHDFGICEILEDDDADKRGIEAHLVEEEDGSINWYVNPNERSDRWLISRKIKFIEER